MIGTGRRHWWLLYMDAWNGKYGSLLKWCLQESSQTFLPGGCDIKRIGPFLICYYYLEGTPKPFIGVCDTWCRRSICCSRSSKNASTPLRRMERTWWLTVACVDAIPGVTFKELITHANSIKQLRFLRLMINMTRYCIVMYMRCVASRVEKASWFSRWWCFMHNNMAFHVVYCNTVPFQIPYRENVDHYVRIHRSCAGNCTMLKRLKRASRGGLTSTSSQRYWFSSGNISSRYNLYQFVIYVVVAKRVLFSYLF